MNRTNQRTMGVILTYIQIIISVIISIFTTPFITKTLGASEYGLYSVVLSLSAYINLFQLGMGSSYIRFYSIYRKNNDKRSIENMNGIYLLIFSGLALIALIFSLVIMSNVHLLFPNNVDAGQVDLARKSIIILTITSVTSFPVSVFTSFIIAHERFVFIKLVNILFSIARTGIIVIVLAIGYRSFAIFLSTLIWTIALDLLYILYGITKLDFKCRIYKFDKNFFFSVFSFSLFIALNSIVDQFNWNTDKLIITKMYGTILTAVYAIGAQLNTMYMEVSTSITDVFTPMIHQLAQTDNTGKSFTSLMIRVGRIQFLILGLALSGFITCGKDFILLWLGSEYSEAYFVSLMLMMPVTIPLVQNIGIEMQRARNKHKFRSILYIFMSIGNLLMTIPLCSRYGIVGAAAGTAVMLVIANGIIMNIYYKKVLDIDVYSFWKEIAKIAVVPIGMSAVSLSVTSFIVLNTVARFLTYAVLFTAIYAFICWNTVMNSYEKMTIYRMLHKFSNTREELS